MASFFGSRYPLIVCFNVKKISFTSKNVRGIAHISYPALVVKVQRAVATRYIGADVAWNTGGYTKKSIYIADNPTISCFCEERSRCSEEFTASLNRRIRCSIEE
jgi:hypothetical protein